MAAAEPTLTPLLLEHYDELQFDLRLRHKPTGKFVGDKGLVNTEREACYFTCGPRGESVEFLHAFFINDAGIQWIAAHPAEEFEITSCLGEM